MKTLRVPIRKLTRAKQPSTIANPAHLSSSTTQGREVIISDELAAESDEDDFVDVSEALQSDVHASIAALGDQTASAKLNPAELLTIYTHLVEKENELKTLSKKLVEDRQALRKEQVQLNELDQKNKMTEEQLELRHKMYEAEEVRLAQLKTEHEARESSLKELMPKIFQDTMRTSLSKLTAKVKHIEDAKKDLDGHKRMLKKWEADLDQRSLDRGEVSKAMKKRKVYDEHYEDLTAREQYVEARKQDFEAREHDLEVRDRAARRHESDNHVKQQHLDKREEEIVKRQDKMIAAEMEVRYREEKLENRAAELDAQLTGMGAMAHEPVHRGAAVTSPEQPSSVTTGNAQAVSNGLAGRFSAIDEYDRTYEGGRVGEGPSHVDSDDNYSYDSEGPVSDDDEHFLAESMMV